MPKKIYLVDYSQCSPEKCDRGICLAVLACPRKILKQEAPNEMPDLNQSMCLGCGFCAAACLAKAVRAALT